MTSEAQRNTRHPALIDAADTVTEMREHKHVCLDEIQA